MKHVWQKISDGWAWLCGAKPQGIGTLLVGIAAIWALLQGSSLLEQVLKVQEQAKEIGLAVGELKKQSQQMASAIDLLGAQLKELRATQAVDSSSALKSPNPTKEQIKEAIRDIPAHASPQHSTIFLPATKFDETVEMIYREKTPSGRAAALRNSLVFKPAILTGNRSANQPANGAEDSIEPEQKNNTEPQ